MTSTALDYIHAARHAIDEGALRTARCLLDSAERHLSGPSATVAATAPKPTQPAKAAPPTIQPSLLAQARGIDEWLMVINQWIRRQPVGYSFTHHQLCKWIEHESGIILNDPESRSNPGDKTAIWKRRISRALGKLKDDGTLSKGTGHKGEMRSGSYLVNRLP